MEDSTNLQIMDIRQSQTYARFLKSIGWEIKKIAGWNIFIRKIPLYGKIAKLQKIKPPIPFQEIEEFRNKEKIRMITIEPDCPENKILAGQFIAHGYKINYDPFIPTKTILIDLNPSINRIFATFSEAKRRAVRKAQKNNIKVIQSDNITEFIKLKTKHFFPFGFLAEKEIRLLWNTFYPQNAALLLTEGAGILLLFWQKKAYYWLAASTIEANKFAAPSLLVFEALKLAKKRGCTIFDFEGIYDSRYHNATKNWQGFTKFKQGFTGSELNYVGSFKKYIL